jgi:hypothetical protein
LIEKGFGLWGLGDEQEVGAGAELTGTCEAAVDQLLGQLLVALGESFGEKDDRIDAGHLEVDGNARVFGGALKVKACIATAGKADGADARIADEFQAVSLLTL